MTGAASRNKGARRERELCKVLGAELGDVLQRNIEQTRNGGADVLCVKGFAIEVKGCERLSTPAWWRQACEQAARVSAEPMLAVKQNRKPWVFWLHTIDGGRRKADVIEAAGHIREKWACWP